MKKTLFAIAALAAMTSCSQEITNIEPQQPKGQTVTIEANLEETKAAVGKNGLSVIWRDYDEISVLVKDGDGNFTENTLFERLPVYLEDGKTPQTDTKGKIVRDKTKPYTFIGSFKTPLAAGANTWYLLHPYSADIASIGNDTHTPPRVIYKTANGEYKMVIENATQDYSKSNKMGHLNLPMYGIGTGNGETTPTIRMEHFCSVFEITVTNKLKEIIKVTSVSIENPEDKITGEFRVKVNDATETEPTPSMTLLASNANLSSELNVTNCTLAPQAAGKFYLLAKDFSLQAGKSITVTIKTDKDYVTAVKKLTKNTSFKVGKIHKTSVNYENPSEYAKVCPVGTTIDFDKKNGLNVLPTYIIQSGKVVWYKETRLRLAEDKTNIIIATDETPSKIFVTAIEDNKNGKTAPILKIYGSTDGINYDLLIEKSDFQNMSQHKDAQPTTFEVPKISAGMKYFKFENNRTDATGNRSICLNKIDFQKTTTQAQ